MGWAIVGTALVVGAGVVVGFLHGVREGECKRFADKVCANSPGSCGDVKLVFDSGRISAAQCREGNHLLENLETQPPGLRVALTSAAFSEAIGAETMQHATHDAMMLLMDIDFQVQQGRSPDDLIKRLRDLGPPACSALIGRLGAPDPKRSDLAHRLLVDLRGQDLGADAGAWRPWCNSVFLDSLKRK
ncbi:MAG TPA: hypothetical protein VKQ32_11730 [Polyangia bacterium]|nr:hypothetical protein [Polyangia bacterium]